MSKVFLVLVGLSLSITGFAQGIDKVEAPIFNKQYFKVEISKYDVSDVKVGFKNAEYYHIVDWKTFYIPKNDFKELLAEALIMADADLDKGERLKVTVGDVTLVRNGKLKYIYMYVDGGYYVLKKKFIDKIFEAVGA